MAEKEYIEKRKLIEAWEREIEDATDLRDAFDFALEDVPAADVVPRLEWLNDCEQLCCPAIAERDAARVERELLQEELDALTSNYTECMKNYAREIFTEIERIHEECIYIDPTTNIGSLKVLKFERMLAELKKKYTEE